MKEEINAVTCDKNSKKEGRKHEKNDETIQYEESYPIR